jgi:hypothetical protein
MKKLRILTLSLLFSLLFSPLSVMSDFIPTEEVEAAGVGQGFYLPYGPDSGYVKVRRTGDLYHNIYTSGGVPSSEVSISGGEYHPRIGGTARAVIDFALGSGDTVRASKTGKVSELYYYGSSFKGAGGNICLIVLDHGNSEKTEYLHMNSPRDSLHVGDSIETGQALGSVLGRAYSSGEGGTPTICGYSGGAHLHFEYNVNDVDSVLRFSDSDTKNPEGVVTCNDGNSTPGGNHASYERLDLDGYILPSDTSNGWINCYKSSRSSNSWNNRNLDFQYIFEDIDLDGKSDIIKWDRDANIYIDYSSNGFVPNFPTDKADYTFSYGEIYGFEKNGTLLVGNIKSNSSNAGSFLGAAEPLDTKEFVFAFPDGRILIDSNDNGYGSWDINKSMNFLNSDAKKRPGEIQLRDVDKDGLDDFVYITDDGNVLMDVSSNGFKFGNINDNSRGYEDLYSKRGCDKYLNEQIEVVDWGATNDLDILYFNQSYGTFRVDTYWEDTYNMCLTIDERLNHFDNYILFEKKYSNDYELFLGYVDGDDKTDLVFISEDGTMDIELSNNGYTGDTRTWDLPTGNELANSYTIKPEIQDISIPHAFAMDGGYTLEIFDFDNDGDGDFIFTGFGEMFVYDSYMDVSENTPFIGHIDQTTDVIDSNSFIVEIDDDTTYSVHTTEEGKIIISKYIEYPYFSYVAMHTAGETRKPLDLVVSQGRHYVFHLGTNNRIYFMDLNASALEWQHFSDLPDELVNNGNLEIDVNSDLDNSKFSIDVYDANNRGTITHFYVNASGQMENISVLGSNKGTCAYSESCFSSLVRGNGEVMSTSYLGRGTTNISVGSNHTKLDNFINANVASNNTGALVVMGTNLNGELRIAGNANFDVDEIEGKTFSQPEFVIVDDTIHFVVGAASSDQLYYNTFNLTSNTLGDYQIIDSKGSISHSLTLLEGSLVVQAQDSDYTPKSRSLDLSSNSWGQWEFVDFKSVSSESNESVHNVFMIEDSIYAVGTDNADNIVLSVFNPETASWQKQTNTVAGKTKHDIHIVEQSGVYTMYVLGTTPKLYKKQIYPNLATDWSHISFFDDKLYDHSTVDVYAEDNEVKVEVSSILAPTVKKVYAYTNSGSWESRDFIQLCTQEDNCIPAGDIFYSYDKEYSFEEFSSNDFFAVSSTQYRFDSIEEADEYDIQWFESPVEFTNLIIASNDSNAEHKNFGSAISENGNLYTMSSDSAGVIRVSEHSTPAGNPAEFVKISGKTDKPIEMFALGNEIHFVVSGNSTDKLYYNVYLTDQNKLALGNYLEIGTDEYFQHRLFEHNGEVYLSAQKQNYSIDLKRLDPTSRTWSNWYRTDNPDTSGFPYSVEVEPVDESPIGSEQGDMKQVLSSIQGMQLWLDAGDLSSSLSNGDTVSQWEDTRSNGIVASEYTSDTAPTFSLDGGNGMPAVHFNSDRLVGTFESDISNDSNTMFVVTEAESTLYRQTVFGLTDLQNSTIQPSYQLLEFGLWPSYDPDNVKVYRGNGTATGFHDKTGIGNYSGFNVWAIHNNGSELVVRLNGQDFYTTSGLSNATNSNDFILGSRDTLRNNLVGDISEFMVFDRPLDEAEAQQTENYLLTKYGFIEPVEPELPVEPAPEPVVNEAPTINLAPFNGEIVDTSLTISWADSDADDNASIELFYDTDDAGVDGTLIATGLFEDDQVNSFTWDVSSLDNGQYYVYAVIQDGTNDMAVSYSDAFTVEHPAPAVSEIGTDGLALWLDASSLTGLNDGDYVAEWQDKSGNNRHALQETESLQPTYLANEVNGHPVVKFNSDRLIGDLGYDVSNDSLTMFIVAESEHAFNRNTVFGLTDVLSTGGTQNTHETFEFSLWTSNNPDTVYVSRGEEADNSYIQRFFDYTAPSFANWSVVSNGEELLVNQNGLALGQYSGITKVASASSFILGSRSTFNNFIGDIAEVIVYDRVLSETEIGEVNTYLADKYAL